MRASQSRRHPKAASSASARPETNSRTGRRAQHGRVETEQRDRASLRFARAIDTNAAKKDDDDDDDVVDLAKGVAARKEARKGEEEEEEQRGKVESILALEKFFAARVARGDVDRAKRDTTRSKRETTTSKKDESMTQSVVDEDAIVEQKKRKYRAWLLRNYKLFLSRMIYVAAHDATATDATRVVAFSGLMEVARVGGKRNNGGGMAEAAIGIVVVVSRLITKFSNERWKSA